MPMRTTFSLPVSNRFEVLATLKDEAKTPSSAHINFSPYKFEKKTSPIIENAAPITASGNTWNWKQVFLFGFSLFSVATSTSVVAKSENAVAKSSECALKEYFPHHLDNYTPALPASITGIVHRNMIDEVSDLLTQKIREEKTFFGKLMQAAGGPEAYSNLPRLNKAEITVHSGTGVPDVSLAALGDEPIKIGRDQYGRSLIAYKYRSKIDSSAKAKVGIIYQKYTREGIWTSKELPSNSVLDEAGMIRYMQIFNGLHKVYELVCSLD
jgi:hypothetical protein